MAPTGAEGCPTCGFDPSEWNDQDTVRTLARSDYLLGHAMAALPAALRPAVDALDGAAFAVLGLDADADREALHRLLHRVTAIAELRAAAGDLPRPQHGRLSAIHCSDGGVPKRPVDVGVVGRRGLQGDRQGERRHHGRPFQAVCLWSAEVIDALRAEGHPIGPGDAGENLTLSGLDWTALRSGLWLEIGSVRCRLSVPAEPCSKISRWFADGRSTRIDHERHPGFSRWYAWVERVGTVHPDDRVVLAPSPERA